MVWYGRFGHLICQNWQSQLRASQLFLPFLFLSYRLICLQIVSVITMSAAAVNLINTGTLETEGGEGWIKLRGSKKVNSRQSTSERWDTVCHHTWLQGGGWGAGGRSARWSPINSASNVQQPYQFDLKTPVQTTEEEQGHDVTLMLTAHRWLEKSIWIDKPYDINNMNKHV